jgi:hypothetical protein
LFEDPLFVLRVYADELSYTARLIGYFSLYRLFTNRLIQIPSAYINKPFAYISKRQRTDINNIDDRLAKIGINRLRKIRKNFSTFVSIWVYISNIKL